MRRSHTQAKNLFSTSLLASRWGSKSVGANWIGQQSYAATSPQTSAPTTTTSTAVRDPFKAQNYSLEIPSLHKRYLGSELTVKQLVTDIQQRIHDEGKDNVWIAKATPKDLENRAAELQSLLDKETGGFREVLHKYPLFGIPFGVKDNIDVAGYPTTAACPDYSYMPKEHSPAVENCLKAGGIFIGKQNMDQFATGLVGVRSPYGVPRNSFNADYVPGGSSSGSAVSVSTGLCSFALATDTAGSGRVPGSFNNVVGLKPTRGLLSNTGMVPACRSLDCMAIFALTSDDAYSVFQQTKGYDERDEYSRREPPAFIATGGHYYHNFGHILHERAMTDYKTIRFGIPDRSNLKFFGDTTGKYELFYNSVQRVSDIEGRIKPVEIPFEPWTQVAKILYDGPWISERLSGIEQFVKEHPDSLFPVTRKIMERGYSFTALDTFKAMRHLEALRRVAEKAWDQIDVLIVPTASVFPKVAEVNADPVGINTQLGYYTNFLNLLDLCAIQLPAGFLPNGMPFGITIIAPAFNDSLLHRIGQVFQNDLRLPLGATGHYKEGKFAGQTGEVVQMAVVGAHLSGQPLNPQLVELGAMLLKTTRTTSKYKLVDLDGKKPGLFHVNEGEQGSSVEVEVWGLPSHNVGKFLENVRTPLGIGNVDLVDGSQVKGFLCEEYVARQARDITSFGGWRSYLQSSRQNQQSGASSTQQ